MQDVCLMPHLTVINLLKLLLELRLIDRGPLQYGVQQKQTMGKVMYVMHRIA